MLRTIVPAAIAIVLLQHPAYPVDMKCSGTEPFWDAQLSDKQIIFGLADGRKVIYVAPHYRAAAGASPDFVLHVSAKRGNASLIAFIVNENLMVVFDKNSKSLDQDTAKAYCSDAMSDRGYPFSIHLLVDGTAYTGCCSTTASPTVEDKASH